MAHTNNLYHQTSYCYPSPNSPPPFIENAGWETALYQGGNAPPIGAMNTPTLGEVYAQTHAISHEMVYTTPGIHAVQPAQSTSTEDWALTSTFQPSPIPFPSPPPYTPTTSSPILQPAIYNRPSTSTNSSDYVWVPQRAYALTAHRFAPAPAISFDVNSGEPGIRLSAALNRKFSHLKHRDDLVFELSKSPTITMRLEWPGYASWGRQVRVLDSRSVQQSISREKLAYEVAKTVFRFTESQGGRLSDAQSAPDRDRAWTIGEGDIGLDDILLVRVENVSKGSWQPQFLVRRRH